MIKKDHTEKTYRREYLKALGGLSIAGVAGCVGEEGESDEGAWIPERNTIEYQTPGSGQHDDLSRIYGPVADEYYSELTGVSIDHTVEGLEAGEGVEMHNSVYNSNPASGIIGIDNLNSVILNEISNPQADFTTNDFRFPARTEIGTRAIQVNPRTWDVDGHFQLTWDEFVAEAEERTLNWPLNNASHTLNAEVFREFAPGLNEDNFVITPMDGFGETGGAIQRGDMDGMFGGYPTNFGARNEYFYTQFVFANPDQSPDLADMLRGVAPEEEVGNFAEEEDVWLPDRAFITNTDYPTDGARELSSVIQDLIVFFLSPETSDEVYDLHVEALEQAGQDQRVEDDISEAYSPENHTPAFGQEVEEMVEDSYDALVNNDEIREIAEDIF